MDKGLLLVLSGPSGTGKGTVCEKLCQQHLTGVVGPHGDDPWS
jgi:guanylate kinase